MEGKSCLIQFKYKCNINNEEEIRLIGGNEEIGNWNIINAKKLKFDSKENIWVSDNISFPQNNSIEYKYTIFKNNKLIKWEELPNNNNRKINIENRTKLIIFDKENDPNGIIEKSDNYNNKIESEKKENIVNNENKKKEEDDKFKDLNYESFIEDDDNDAKRHSFYG